jgi:hypothetical protein
MICADFEDVVAICICVQRRHMTAIRDPSNTSDHKNVRLFISDMMCML